VADESIAGFTVQSVLASEQTRWTFLSVQTSSGVVGSGEATFQPLEAAMFDQAADLLPKLVGSAVDPGLVRRLPPPGDLQTAAVYSALSQALWDAVARSRGVPLATALGRVRRSSIPMYANINRRTADRSPAGFMESARAAVVAGHTSFKIAPFDEVAAPGRGGGRASGDFRPGIDRIAAVRDAIGKGAELRIDCHWRFEEAMAADAIRAAAASQPYWIEAPLPETETEDNFAALRRLRKLANDLGIKLAGCERGVGIDEYSRYIAAGAYDVMMPDIKYVGSVEDTLELAERFGETGVGFSLHNPSGPISHAASLHVSAVVETNERLEMQFDETPVFDGLLKSPSPQVRGGLSPLPEGPGLGLAFDPAHLRQFVARTMTVDGSGVRSA
jgi:galactonate dehydratase